MKIVKKIIATAIIVLATMTPVALPNAIAWAADTSTDVGSSIQGNLNQVQTTARFNKTDLPLFIAQVIQLILSLLGVVFLLLIVYAGFQWMTSRGESGVVKKAKDLLTEAVIGLIIILSANTIAFFVIRALQTNILKP